MRGEGGRQRTSAGRGLAFAPAKSEVVRIHSRKAKVHDLNASILTAEARLQSAQNSYQLEKTQESEIEQTEKELRDSCDTSTDQDSTIVSVASKMSLMYATSRIHEALTSITNQ